MKFLELRVPPVAVWLIAAALTWIVSRAVPDMGLVIPGRRILAALLATVAFAIAVAGIVEFRRHRTTVHPFRPEETSAIVTSGIFRRTRNPMYLGLLLLLGAWAVFLGNVFGLLVLPLFIAWITRFQIYPEERILVERFGHEYADYAMHVRRWF